MSILPNTSPSFTDGPIGSPTTTAIPHIRIDPSHKEGTLSTLAIIFLLLLVILTVVLAIVIVFLCLLKKKLNGGATGPPPPPPGDEEAPEVLDVAVSEVESEELEVEAVGAGALEVEGVQAVV
nr:hypothetical protein CFP56_45833 [Quercus suber]